MRSIVICEDTLKQRQRFEEVVRNYIMIEDLEIDLALVASEPDSVLEYLEETPIGETLYFLDIDLGEDKLTGMDLARLIREKDDLSKIAFITTLSQSLPLTFKYRLEALDFIIKDDFDGVDQQIRECIDTAFERSQMNTDKKQKFIVQLGARTKSLDIDDIYYFQATDGHKIILVGDDEYVEYYDTLAEIENNYSHFFRVHRSYVANLEAAIGLDRSAQELHFPDEVSVPVGRTRMKELVAKLEELGKA
ncbi:LytR/AlgR family response regulator transcription factor [Hutsoniella sourekii]